jgi:hypothetical protein
VVDRRSGQQPLDDAQRFVQPRDPLARRIEGDPGRVVFGLIPAGAQAELEPSAGNQMQARRLVRHDRRMPEVVGQHDGAQPQPGGHRGRGGQAAERRQLLPERARREMVPQQQHIDPAVLHLPSEIKPRLTFPHRLAHHPEPQPRHAQARYRSRPPGGEPRTRGPQTATSGSARGAARRVRATEWISPAVDALASG